MTSIEHCSKPRLRLKPKPRPTVSRPGKIYALRLPLDQASMGLGGNLPRLTSQARREHSRCRRSHAHGVRPSVSRR